MEPSQETLTDLNHITNQVLDNPKTLSQRGETQRLMGHYQQALANFDLAIALKPNYAWALAHRGETQRLMGRYRAALADFNRALELRSDYVWALAHRGTAYKLMAWYEPALADFNRVLELEPDYVWTLVHRGLTHIILKRYEAALADFDQALALDQTVISHWPGERGLLLNFLGRYEETIASCEAALQDDPDDYIARYSLVVARACRQGADQTQPEIRETQAVLQAMLHVVENGKMRAGVLYRLGGLAALLGQPDQALGYLQETIPLDDEPTEQARHDPAWHDLRADPRFQSLVAKATITWEERSPADETLSANPGQP